MKIEFASLVEKGTISFSREADKIVVEIAREGKETLVEKIYVHEFRKVSLALT